MLEQFLDKLTTKCDESPVDINAVMQGMITRAAVRGSLSEYEQIVRAVKLSHKDNLDSVGPSPCIATLTWLRELYNDGNFDQEIERVWDIFGS